MRVTHPGQTPVDLVAFYFQFRKDTAYFVREIMNINKQLAKRVIMGIAVNAFNPWWHHPRRNDKGRLVKQMITSTKLMIQNRPDNC